MTIHFKFWYWNENSSVVYFNQLSAKRVETGEKTIFQPANAVHSTNSLVELRGRFNKSLHVTVLTHLSVYSKIVIGLNQSISVVGLSTFNFFLTRFSFIPVFYLFMGHVQNIFLSTLNSEGLVLITFFLLRYLVPNEMVCYATHFIQFNYSI